MVNKYIFKYVLLFLLSCANSSNGAEVVDDNKDKKCSEPNVRADLDCGYINSALFAKAIINALGKEAVIQMLEQKKGFSFMAKVDYCGRVLQLSKTKMNYNNFISNDMLHKIESYLIKNEICFYIWYSWEYKGKEDVIKRDIMRSKNDIYIVLAFGGLVSYHYDIALRKNPNLTKYDFLQQQIEKYLGNE